MKTRRMFVFAAVLLLSASLFTGCMMMSPTRTVSTVTYENPQWAPPYYSGARYYYLPDIELYYDLSAREFIYLMDGRWNFSPYIPPMYRDYELDNSFCIVLNTRVYKPWLHHQYYVSHYPRYYYRDYYDHSNIPYVRAYNENIRRAVYWNANERHRARTWDDSNVRDNRRFKYSKDDRQEQKNWNQNNQDNGSFGGGTRNDGRTQQQQQQNNNTQNRTSTRTQATTQPKSETNQNRTETTTRATEAKPKTETTRTTESTRTTTTTTRQPVKEETPAVRNNRTNYYGKTIGNSVPVTKQMREKTTTPAAKNTRQTTTTR